MDYNKIIIALVIILVAVAVSGFVMLNQSGNKTINNSTNVTNTTNSTNATNVTNTTPHISTDEVNTNQESSSSSGRTYADMAHDSDAHTNPEKAKELNDNIVGGKDGIYYFSDGSSVDMR